MEGRGILADDGEANVAEVTQLWDLVYVPNREHMDEAHRNADQEGEITWTGVLGTRVGVRVGPTTVYTLLPDWSPHKKFYFLKMGGSKFIFWGGGLQFRRKTTKKNCPEQA